MNPAFSTGEQYEPNAGTDALARLLYVCMQLRANTNEMAWIYLLLAGIFEVAWAISLKYTAGYTRLWPSMANFAVMLLGVGLLSKSVVTLPVATAYATWTGIGVVGTTALGIIVFNEPRNWLHLFFISLILFGIVGLKATTPK